MVETQGSVNRQIARAAGTVMIAFIFSNLAGLARQILVAGAFGTSAEMEAFNAANRVAETLFLLVAGGALASAFIPTFTGLLAQEHRQVAWKLASAVANLVLLILMVASGLAAVFAPQIVRYVLAPGFAADPAKEALTIDLMRLQLPSAVLFGLGGLIAGVLNTYQIFLVPALTPAMYQLGMIFGVLVLSPTMGVYGLGWGVVIGAGLYVALQVPALLRLKGGYYSTLGLHLPSVREVARLMGPRLLGVAVVQLNFWVNTRLASRMDEGSVTGVVLAFSLMLMPQAAIAQSIAIAAMPTLSAQFAQGRLDEMRTLLAASLRGALLLSIPASLGLMLLREPVVRLLYERDMFTERSTELVAWALLWYAAGLVGHAVVEILSRAFYALHDTRMPVFVGIGAMSLNVVLSLALARLFAQWGWMPHGGLALANTLATALEAVALVVFMRRRLTHIDEKRVMVAVLQAGVASVIMAGVLAGWLGLAKNVPDWLLVGGGIVTGLGVYACVASIVGVGEVKDGINWVIRKLMPA